MDYDDEYNREHDIYEGSSPDDHDAAQQYWDQGSAADDSVASTLKNGRRNKGRREYDNASMNAKMADPGYFKHKYTVKGKPVTIEYYFTPIDPDRIIRNAVTGQYETGYKTGSRNRDMFFKVVTGNCSKSHHLYYDSPEQFERHFHTTVSPTIKEEWNIKATNQRRFWLETQNEKHERETTRIH
jgi:hypothetical protein